MQQGALAGGADAGDLVERTSGEVLLAPRAMGSDGEAMRLVAQALDEIERRIARRQPERRLAGDEKGFASGVAIGALGDRRDRDVLDGELSENSVRRVELSFAAVDQDEVRPLRKSVRLRRAFPDESSPAAASARARSLASRTKRRRSTSRIMP